MAKQTSLMVLACLSIVTVCGCGPTKSGLEFRVDARKRMDLVSAKITFEQASQSFESGKFDRALREIDAAIRRYPDNASYFVLRGRIFLETRNLERALESFKVARQLDEGNAKAWYYSGIVFQRWSNDQQAFESYKQAFEFDTNNIHYLLAAAETLIALGDYESARQLVEPKLAFFEYNAALKQIQAQIAMFQNRPEDAVCYYADARLLEPEDMVLLEQLAWAQFAAEKYDDCLESAKYIQHKNKTERLDLTRLEAQCLSMMGRVNEAKRKYVTLSRKLASDPDIWAELGTLAWEVDDFARVTESGSRLIALRPNRYEGYLFLAIAAKHNDRPEEAIKLLRKSGELASDIAAPHMLLGHMLENSGVDKQALIAYLNAIKAEPGNRDAHFLYDQLNQTQQLTSITTEE